MYMNNSSGVNFVGWWHRRLLSTAQIAPDKIEPAYNQARLSLLDWLTNGPLFYLLLTALGIGLVWKQLYPNSYSPHYSHVPVFNFSSWLFCYKFDLCLALAIDILRYWFLISITEALNLVAQIQQQQQQQQLEDSQSRIFQIPDGVGFISKEFNSSDSSDGESIYNMLCANTWNNCYKLGAFLWLSCCCKRGNYCSLKYNGFKLEQMIPVVPITDWDEWHVGLLSSIQLKQTFW